MKLYVRTETSHYTRKLIITWDQGRRALGKGKRTLEFFGDPTKAVALLMIFNNSQVKGWICGRGLEVEAPPEAWQALEALCKHSLTWKQAAEYGFLQKPTPQHILKTLSLNALLE